MNHENLNAEKQWNRVGENNPFLNFCSPLWPFQRLVVRAAESAAAAESTVAATVTTETATTTAAAAVPGVAAATVEAGHFEEFRVDFLLGLLEDGDEVAGLLVVFLGEEGDGSTLGASTSGTADTVDIVFAVVGVVVVDDVCNTLDICIKLAKKNTIYKRSTKALLLLQYKNNVSEPRQPIPLYFIFALQLRRKTECRELSHYKPTV